MEKKTDSKSRRKRNPEYTRLIIALILLFGIIVAFALYLSWPLLTGKTLVLATMPVDPVDIFRGQYISVRYEISSIPAISGAEKGSTVYVILKKGEGGIYRYDGASLTEPQGDFIKGKVAYVYDKNMNVEYGIEQYFFERGAEFSTRNLTIEVKVSSSGQARITRLLKDNKPVEIKYSEDII